MFLDDGNTCVSAGLDRTIRFWDLKSGLQRLVVETDPGIPESLTVAPDKMALVAGCRDGKIRIFRRAIEAEVRKAER